MRDSINNEEEHEKSTRELENILGEFEVGKYEAFLRENADSMLDHHDDFRAYIKEQTRKRGMDLRELFRRADIPDGYGYKLVSGEKHTFRRDVIIRICYAAELTLVETQRALRRYGMPELYVKNPRDAFLILAFRERPGDICDVNNLLIDNHMEPLSEVGNQE